MIIRFRRTRKERKPVCKDVGIVRVHKDLGLRPLSLKDKHYSIPEGSGAKTTCGEGSTQIREHVQNTCGRQHAERTAEGKVVARSPLFLSFWECGRWNIPGTLYQRACNAASTQDEPLSHFCT